MFVTASIILRDMRLCISLGSGASASDICLKISVRVLVSLVIYRRFFGVLICLTSAIISLTSVELCSSGIRLMDGRCIL